VNPRNVATAPVAAQQHHATGKGGFQQRQNIIAIHPQFAAANVGGSHLMFISLPRRLCRAGATAHGQALAAGEIMPVSDQFGG
jgi:hypothetical protein